MAAQNAWAAAVDRRFLLTVAGLTVAAFLLRMWGAASQSIWVDETFSIAWAGVFEGMRIERLTGNLQGPLHALGLFLWSRLFGAGELALRTFGVVLGTAAIPVTAWALLPIRPVERGLAVCALLAASPFHVWYSQEIRNYVLAMLLATVSLGAFLRLLAAPPGSRRTWLLYTAANLLGMWSNLSFSFLLAAQGAWLAWRALVRDRAAAKLLRRAAVSWAVVLVVLTPWFLQFYQRSIIPSGALGAPPAESLRDVRGAATSPVLGIPYAYYVFATGFSYGPSLRELHEFERFGLLALLRRHLPALLLAGAAFGGVGLLGVRRLWREKGVGRAWLLWAVVPVLLTFVVTLRNLKVFNVRYAAGAFLPVLVILACGALAPRRGWMRAALLALLLVPSAISLVSLRTDERYWKEDARSLAAFLRTETRPGDLLFTVGSIQPLWEYYWKLPPGKPAHLELADAWPWYWQRVPREEQFVRFEQMAAGHSRTLVLFYRAKDVDRQGAWADYLAARGGIAREVRWPGLRMLVLGEGGS